jgi:hypothetical protein
MQLAEATSLNRKSGGADLSRRAVDGSAVPRTFPGNTGSRPATELSSRLPRRAVGPERTRISCHAALDKTARAPFLKERRMMFANATNFHRKSGVAQWRDLCVDAPSWKCFSTGAQWRDLRFVSS